MRHVIVTRIALSLAALFAAAVVIFSWAATRTERDDTEAPAETTGPSGAELFARHCAMCHQGEEAEIAFDYRKAPDRDAAIAELRVLLVDHYGPSPEGISRIVDHLVSGDEP